MTDYAKVRAILDAEREPLDDPEADMRDAAVIVRLAPALLAVAEIAGDIAALTEDDIRDYEQGMCFFCGAGGEVIPGPRGGVTGERARRRIHEPTCSYIAARAALDALDAEVEKL